MKTKPIPIILDLPEHTSSVEFNVDATDTGIYLNIECYDAAGNWNDNRTIAAATTETEERLLWSVANGLNELLMNNSIETEQ